MAKFRRVIDELTPLSKEWQNGSPATKRRLRRVMLNAGQRLAEAVGLRAPRLTGALEESPSAQTRETGDGVQTIVYIKTGGLNTKRPGAFLKFIHDGRYNLGLKSQAKQGGQTEEVGPEFLDRALEDEQDDILREIEEAFYKGAAGE